jgi:hypothetical protein
MEKKTSQEWLETIPKKYKVTIFDPDGWDRTNYDYSFYEEQITLKEFKDRLMRSTVLANKEFYNYNW